MAGHKVVRLHFLELRAFLETLVGSHRAAGCETAAGRGLDRRCDLTFHDFGFFALLGGIRHGDSREQSLCIGVQRSIEECVGIGHLDHLAKIQNQDIVTDVLDD